jgi:tripartite-type tricarboxylate transporter receptor subunit TctC
MTHKPKSARHRPWSFGRVAAAALCAILAIGLGAQSGHAAWKPKKEIRIIVPAGPGGGSDQFVRQIVKAAETIAPSVKFVVDNISGGGGATGFTAYMGMEPDGHVYISVYPEIALMLADGTLPYSIDQVVPVMRAQNGPATVLAKGDEGRFKTYDEMIAYMKKNNAELVVATYTLRGFDDLTLAAIEKKEGVRFKRVPYVKAGERFAAVMGGHVDLMTQRIGDVVKFIEAKRMTPIIVDVPDRLKTYPDTPTFKDKKIPFDLGYWRGIWAKKGTPPEAVAYLDGLLRRAMDNKSYKEYEEKGFYHIVQGYMDHKTFADSSKREFEVYKAAYGKKP